MTDRFGGKVVAITGAAGGIGRAAAERFGREGAHVVAVDVNADALAETVHAVEKEGGAAIAVVADVTEPAHVERYVAEARRAFGGLDALFNNAGIEGVVAPFESYPLDVFDRVLAVNVRGVLLGIQYAVPALRERGGGAIVNTSSVAGLTGNPMVPAYVASKHAVLGLTKSAAQAYAAEGIRVNAVCPSAIETRMMRSLEAGFSPGDPEALKATMEASIPSGRYGTPEEVAALVAFLCSDDAAYINGATITIDGAMTTASARL
jgi:NAD(P)-dependent dehydrogenase (short-subunit alcohol dehydrogenase family)